MNVLFPRDGCKSPQQYYTCASNGFKGCCSVDPCPLPGCPDSSSQDGKSSTSQDQPPKPKDYSATSNVPPGIQSAPTSYFTTTLQFPDTVVTGVPSVVTGVPSVVTGAPSAVGQPLGSLPSSATSSQAPFTIVVVSTAVQTPTSNGIALAPTTLLVTNTAYSSPGAAVQTSSSTPSAISGGSPSSNTPVIGGVVGGVGGVLIVAALLWFCFRRRSKKRRENREEKAAHGHEDDPREQGIDAHRAGDVIAGYKGFNRGVDRHLKVKARESMAGSESTVTAIEHGHNVEKKLPTPPITPNHPGYTEEAVPYLDSTPVRPNFEMIGSSPDPTGFTPELSGVAAAHQPAELYPNPERLKINNRPSASSEVANAGSRTSDGSVMRSNLNLSNRGPNRRAPNGPARHVLSWMEYSPNGTPMTDGTDYSSPTSGVWSSAESSLFVRNSGVSQDPSTHGWQRERRIRDGGGGLEAITDQPRT